MIEKAVQNRSVRGNKSRCIGRFEKLVYSIGARGSLERGELGSVGLHWRTSSGWRAADYCHHMPEGDLGITPGQPARLGGNSHRTTNKGFRPCKEIAEPPNDLKRAKQLQKIGFKMDAKRNGASPQSHFQQLVRDTALIAYRESVD